VLALKNGREMGLSRHCWALCEIVRGKTHGRPEQEAHKKTG
jgi:hypothetical protein